VKEALTVTPAVAAAAERHESLRVREHLLELAEQERQAKATLEEPQPQLDQLQSTLVQRQVAVALAE
jgi:hypothetical protein